MGLRKKEATMGAENRILAGKNGRNQYDITNKDIKDLKSSIEMKNSSPITLQQLDVAFSAWDAARETAIQEQIAWNNVIQSHKELIASLRLHGHTWTKAQVEFTKLSNTHSDNLINAWKAMDERCDEYQKLLTQYKSNQSKNDPS